MPFASGALESLKAGPPRTGRIVLLRSLAYNMLVAAHVCVTSLVTGPFVFVLPHRFAVSVAKWWASTSLHLLKAVIGIEVEIRGREHIPANGGLVAAKHQSALETLALMACLSEPVFVLKQELTWVPLFGWYLKKLKMIAIDRSSAASALLQMLDQAEVAIRAARQVVIFPEGTRRPVGAAPRYRQGAARLYERLNVPCTPVALDTGVFWPRRTLRRRQGRAVIEFLPAIEPGLDRATFERLLRERIERATDALVAEALGDGDVAPSSHEARSSFDKIDM